MPDSQTIPLIQNVQFQGAICPGKFQLDQIQNGHFNMHNINYNIKLTARPLLIKQNVWFQGAICPEKYQINRIQNGCCDHH